MVSRQTLARNKQCARADWRRRVGGPLLLAAAVLLAMPAWAQTDTPTVTPTETPTSTPTDTPTNTPCPQTGCVGSTCTVNTTADHDDGCCTTEDCTLREALAYSNSGDGVVYSSSLTPSYPATTNISTLGALTISHGVTVTGPGLSNLTITENGTAQGFVHQIDGNVGISGFRFTGIEDPGSVNNIIGFQVDAGSFSLSYSEVTGNDGENCPIETLSAFSSNPGTTTISHVSWHDITNEQEWYFSGLAALIENSSFVNISGGFATGNLISDAPLTINRSLFSGWRLEPGMIMPTASLAVSNSTFNDLSGNLSVGHPLTAVIATGNINVGMVVTNSTFSNLADHTNITFTFSGVQSGVSLALSDVVVAMDMSDIVVAVCNGGIPMITSGGHNIVTDSSCNLTSTGDQQNTDPLLNTLADNGGPTQTMSLQAGSPAINGGDDSVCAASPVNGVDQRGMTRPGVGQTHCSVGAFEEQAAPTDTPTSTPACFPLNHVCLVNEDCCSNSCVGICTVGHATPTPTLTPGPITPLAIHEIPTGHEQRTWRLKVQDIQVGLNHVDLRHILPQVGFTPVEVYATVSTTSDGQSPVAVPVAVDIATLSAAGVDVWVGSGVGKTLFIQVR